MYNTWYYKRYYTVTQYIFVVDITMAAPLSARITRLRCSEHPQQKPRYFCCDKLICSLCYRNHSHHKLLLNLEEKSEEMKQSLPNMLQSLEKMQHKVELKIKQKEDLLRKNTTLSHRNKENIHKRIQDVINYFKVVEQNIKRDCKKRHEQVEQELNEMIDKQKNVHDELKTLQLSCTSLQSYRSTTEIVRVGIKLNDQFNAIDTNEQGSLPSIPEFICPDRIGDKDTIRRLIGTIHDGLDMDSDWTTDESDRFEIVKSFKFKHENVGIAPLSVDSAWLYTVDGPIRMISQNGVVMKEVPNLKKRKIEKISTTKLNNAWVTDLEKCSVKMLTEQGELEHRFSIASPFHLFGICPTRSGKSIWICLADKSSFIPKLKGRTKVVEMTNSGVTLREIENQNRNNFFTFPYKCAENINEDLCVVDRITENKGQVFIFDKNCDPKGGYIGTDVDKDFDPRDICCNSKGNIIISDFTNNVIHILDQDGNVERLLNTASHDLRQPVTIATDVNDRIWVTFNDGNIIIIKYP